MNVKARGAGLQRANYANTNSLKYSSKQIIMQLRCINSADVKRHSAQQTDVSDEHHAPSALSPRNYDPFPVGRAVEPARKIILRKVIPAHDGK
jgi:hypothetical protein